MKTLFSNARVINPESLTDSIGSLLIENDKIAGIYNGVPSLDFNIDKVIAVSYTHLTLPTIYSV